MLDLGDEFINLSANLVYGSHADFLLRGFIACHRSSLPFYTGHRRSGVLTTVRKETKLQMKVNIDMGVTFVDKRMKFF